MGFGVGIPMMKLSNHPSKKSSKGRTGTLRSIACEALEERWGKDPDIDREMTQHNEYQGITSGLALMDALTKDAEAYSKERQEAGGRALRADASIGFVAIIKPDMEAINAMDPDTRRRFFRDAEATLDELLQAKESIASVIHVDEIAWHEHRFYPGRLKDGTLCVDKLVCPNTFKRVNERFPQMMRDKGWEVDDCEMYDEARAKTDPEYVEQRRQRRKEQGQTSRKYKQRKQQEQQEQIAKEREALQAERAAFEADKAIAADRQQRTLQQIRSEYQQLNEGRRQIQAQQQAVEAERRRIEAREAIVTEKYAQTARQAVQAATEALKRAPEDKRDSLAVQANARAAAQNAIDRAAAEEQIRRATQAAPSRTGQQWQRGPGFGL